MARVSNVYLINPPGWILSAGGPYIALPLLKSALAQQEIESKVVDANLDVALFYDLKILQQDIERLKKNFTLKSLNKPYFNIQNKMQQMAASFNATWDIQLGFIPKGYDYSSSQSVRKFSKVESIYTRYYIDKLIPDIINENPVLVGISIIVPQQLLPTFELCRLLRAAGYDGHIILGGNMITRIGNGFNLSWVFEIINALALFSGEITISEYCKCITKNKSFSNVPNLVWQTDGEIVSNKIKYLKVDEFVRPDFSDIKIFDYWGNKYFPLLGSRGCYYAKCSFCSIPFSYGNNGFLGHENPLLVFRDIVSNYNKFRVNCFKFVEEAMFPLTLKKISEEILKEKIECYFEGYARFDEMWNNEKFLDLVSRAGLKKIYLGLELIPSRNRYVLNKSDSLDIVEMLKKFNDAGIKVHLFTLFGYPGTGVNEAIDTIHFTLEHESLIDTLDVFPFAYAKHTKVPFATPRIDEKKDWAVEYEYDLTEEAILTNSEVRILTERLESVIWEENPKWLHPTYRMISPFGINVN